MSENTSKGAFIVFEGIDGAGKTTQIKLLGARLGALGKKVFLTCEPTDLPSGKSIRRALSGQEPRTPCEMAALFTLDRICHNTDAVSGIRKMLDEGYTVICDRYYYSSMAYQGSLTDLGWVKDMNFNCPEIIHPDVCLFLDLTPEQSMERIKANRESVEIYENLTQLKKTRDTFMKVFDLLKDVENVRVINASGSIQDIAEAIYGEVAGLLNK